MSILNNSILSDLRHNLFWNTEQLSAEAVSICRLRAKADISFRSFFQKKRRRISLYILYSTRKDLSTIFYGFPVFSTFPFAHMPDISSFCVQILDHFRNVVCETPNAFLAVCAALPHCLHLPRPILVSGRYADISENLTHLNFLPHDRNTTDFSGLPADSRMFPEMSAFCAKKQRRNEEIRFCAMFFPFR